MSLSFKEARKIYANICSSTNCANCPLNDIDTKECLMGAAFVDDNYIESILLEEKKKHWKSSLDRVVDAGLDKPSGQALTNFCFCHCPGEYLPYTPKCTAEEKKLYQHSGECFICWLKKGWIRSE